MPHTESDSYAALLLKPIHNIWVYLSAMLLSAISPGLLERAMRAYPFAKLIGDRGRVAAWRALGCTLGRGVTIGPRVAMRCPSNVSVGDGSSIGGSVLIDAWQPVTIGKCCLLNDHIDLLTGSHDVNSRLFAGVVAPITIEDYAWLPRRIIVLPGVTVGRAAVVATGSVVVRDVPPRAIVAGNPATVVGARKDVDFAYVPGDPAGHRA